MPRAVSVRLCTVQGRGSDRSRSVDVWRAQCWSDFHVSTSTAAYIKKERKESGGSVLLYLFLFESLRIVKSDSSNYVCARIVN